MELKSKFYLMDNEGEKFMGIGVMWLLEETAKQGSLRKAAAVLELSYSKAFAMIKRLETSLGREVLSKRKGGQSRDGSSLTEFGKQFLTLYEEFQKEAKKAVEMPYNEFSRRLAVLMEDKDERET